MSRVLSFCSILIMLFSSSHFIGQTNHNSRPQSMKFIQPKYLEAGDTIAIVAPAGILKNKKHIITKAKNLAESWGLKVIIGKHVYDQNHHFAGTDLDRASDFQKALDNPNIKAIWCARGGYGSVRILDLLDFSKFKKSPKWIIGYSDITAIHNQFHNLWFETLHAMMPASMVFDETKSEKSKESLKNALFGKELSYQVPVSRYNKTGTAKGQLIGGNMTMLLTMLGSESSIDTRGKILFIEEIGEYNYHIDRIMQSLKRAGYFKHLEGLIVGDMTNIKKNTTLWGSSTYQLIKDAVSEYKFPILFGFPAGHEPDNRALIFGRQIKMETSKNKASLVFLKD